MTQNNRANNNKQGRFGNARDGAVTPRERREAKARIANGFGLRMEDVEDAEYALVDALYDDFNRELIFRRVKGGVGGGGSALYFGTVMGGNSTTTRTPTAEFTGSSLIALPAPFYTDTGELAPYTMPSITDWSDYPQVMPGYIAYGSALPVLPDGLCYVRLERPYTLLGKSWDAGYPPNIVNQITAPPKAITARISSGLNKIIVHWDTELARVSSLGLFHLFDITEDRVVALSSVTKDENKTTINLSKTLDATHAYTLTIDARAVFATQVGTPEHRGRANDPQELSAVFELLSASLVICLNRVGAQSFYAGDLVSIQNTGLEITDSKGVTRAIAEILSNATNARSPHTHIISDFGNDGGIGSLP